jgi:hypothetical protein
MAGGKKRVELKFFDAEAVKAALFRYHSDHVFREEIDRRADKLSNRVRAEAFPLSVELLLHGAAVMIEGVVGKESHVTLLEPSHTSVHYINDIIPAKSPRRKLRLVRLPDSLDPPLK